MKKNFLSRLDRTGKPVISFLPMKVFCAVAMIALSFFIFACEQPPDSKVEAAAEPSPNFVPPYVASAMALLENWDDEHDNARRMAAVRLGTARHPSSVDLINAHMQIEVDPKIRATFAWAAGQIADDRSLNILIEATNDKAPQVRHEAILALARLPHEEAKQTLMELAASTDDDTRLEAARALELIGMAPDKIPDRSFKQEAMPKAGKSWYVDASEGDDENPGTASRPFKTLARAVPMLRRGMGDTLLATSGKMNKPFREKLSITSDQAGDFAAPTIIRNWPGKNRPQVYASTAPKTQTDGDFLSSDPIEDSPFCALLVGKHRTIFLDPAPSPATLKPGGFFYDDNSKRVLVYPPPGFEKARLEVGIRDDAIHIKNADHVHILGFTAAFAQDTGIDFDGSYYGLVQDSRVHDCDRHGIFFFYSAFGMVTKTEVSRCRFQGISVRSSPNSVVHECFAHDVSQDGVLFLFDSDGGVVSSTLLARNARGIGFITGSNFGRVIDCTFSANKDDVTFDPDCDGVILPAK